MKQIEQILKGIEIDTVRGKKVSGVSGITFDSRNVTPGSLFFAVRGYKTDGHDFIGKAIAAGASAVVCETIPADAGDNVSWIRTKDTARALEIGRAHV